MLLKQIQLISQSSVNIDAYVTLQDFSNTGLFKSNKDLQIVGNAEFPEDSLPGKVTMTNLDDSLAY